MSISRHQAAGAYLRWTPEDFGSPAPEAATEPASAVDIEAAIEAEEIEFELPPELKLPTAAELELMQEEMRAAAAEEGRREGHAAGYAEGFAAGEQDGYAAGQARAAAEAEQLATLVKRADEALATIDHQVAEELIALAIELARQLIGDSLRTHPETIVDTVRQALQHLPQASARIELHGEDLLLVKQYMGEELAQCGHRLQDSTRLQRGDCRIEVEGAELDATVETRWRRILEALGREHSPFRALPEDTSSHEPKAGAAGGERPGPVDEGHMASSAAAAGEGGDPR